MTVRIERGASGAAKAAAGFPTRRMRRLRRTESLRRLVRETALAPAITSIARW